MIDVNDKQEECPFAGAYPKCNNAEGCSCCKEFETWLKENDLEFDLEKCPACGGTAHFFARNFGIKSTPKYKAICDTCQLQTPWVSSRTSAARIWNKRVGGKQHAEATQVPVL